jgi:hypothetical protein
MVDTLDVFTYAGACDPELPIQGAGQALNEGDPKGVRADLLDACERD